MAHISLPQSRGTGLALYWHDFRAWLHHWRLVLTYLSASKASRFVSFNDGRPDSSIAKPPRYGACTWVVYGPKHGEESRVDSSQINHIFGKEEYGY